jgi:hypothetical protein
MNLTWELTDMELVVLRDKLFGRSLPRPMIFTSDIKYHDDYVREMEAVWERLRANWDSDLAQRLELMTKPDIRILVQAWDPRNVDDPNGRIRMLAARIGALGLLLRQLPGKTSMHSGGYVLTEYGSGQLASAIVKTLPTVPAGTLGRVELAEETGRDAVDHWYGRSSVLDTADDHDRDVHNRRWRKAEVSCVGVLEVVQGRSAFGPRGIVLRRIFWQDHVGDGRYAVVVDNPVAAVSIDDSQLEAMIDREIAVVTRTLQDESAGSDNRGSIYE